MNRGRTSEQQKTYWSLRYLIRKGISLGEHPGQKDLDAWKQGAALSPGGIKALVQMENAWKTHLSRQKSLEAGKKPSNYVLSSQSKTRLTSLAKQSGRTITHTLESLILDAHQLMKQERATAKAAQEELSRRAKELDSTRKQLNDCIARLSDCTVVMEGAGLSIKELTDAQKRESKKRQPEMLRALSGSSITAVLNVLLGDTFDRAND